MTSAPRCLPSWGGLCHPQSLNLYSYVRNNPLSRTDPDGHRDSSAKATANTKCQDVKDLHVNDAMKTKLKRSEGEVGTNGESSLAVPVKYRQTLFGKRSSPTPRPLRILRSLLCGPFPPVTPTRDVCALWARLRKPSLAKGSAPMRCAGALRGGGAHVIPPIEMPRIPPLFRDEW